jgi:hypothetical protein
MDIPLYPNGYSPRPKHEVEIEEIETAVYPDRRRVFAHVRLTPFLERPNLLITARRSDDRIAAELDIIETMHHDMEFTLHLRLPEDPEGGYALIVEVYYESKNPPQARAVKTFRVPSAAEMDAASAEDASEA